MESARGPKGMEAVHVTSASVWPIVAFCVPALPTPQSATIVGTAPPTAHVRARMTRPVTLQGLLVKIAKPTGSDPIAKKNAPGLMARFAPGGEAAHLGLTLASVFRALPSDSGMGITATHAFQGIGGPVAMNNVRVVHAGPAA